MTIKETVREYLIRTYFNSSASALPADDAPLVDRGIMDSLGMLELVAFLERHFEIEFMPREIGLEDLNSINNISELVSNKLSKERAANPAISPR